MLHVPDPKGSETSQKLVVVLQIRTSIFTTLFKSVRERVPDKKNINFHFGSGKSFLSLQAFLLSSPIALGKLGLLTENKYCIF